MQSFLSKKQKKQLLRRLKSEKKLPSIDPIRRVLLLDKGKTFEGMAEYLFLDEGTVSNNMKGYKEGGIRVSFKRQLSRREMAVIRKREKKFDNKA